MPFPWLSARGRLQIIIIIIIISLGIPTRPIDLFGILSQPNLRFPTSQTSYSYGQCYDKPKECKEESVKDKDKENLQLVCPKETITHDIQVMPLRTLPSKSIMTISVDRPRQVRRVSRATSNWTTVP